MDPTSHLHVPDKGHVYSWDVYFKKRKPARTYLQENHAHYRYKYDVSGKYTSFIRTSMEDSRASQRFLCRADHVESFCGAAHVEGLQRSVDEQATRPIALVDERQLDYVGISETGCIARTSKGPLSSQQLHEHLSRPRYIDSSAASSSDGRSGSGPESPDADAERRLIYITDMNRFTVLALLDTASYSQANFLRDFIYNHLTFSPLFSLALPMTYKIFALEFHLPFFAWRKGPKCIEDERRMSDGRPLRRSQNLSFLDATPSENHPMRSNDFIYEAQVSCLVSGLDDYSWIAYSFVDTFHNKCQSGETGNEDEDSVLYHHERETTHGLVPLDPLSGGSLRADRPEWNPRMYFLRVLESRIEQVKHEWINIVSQIQKKTCKYTQDYQVSTNLYHSSDPDNRGERMKRFHDWTVSTLRLLGEVTHVLSRTIQAWSRFRDREAQYFLGEQGSTDALLPSLCLLAIDKHMDEMRDQLQSLRHQEKVCNNISRELACPPGIAAAVILQDNGLTHSSKWIIWSVTTALLYPVIILVIQHLNKRNAARTDKVLLEESSDVHDNSRQWAIWHRRKRRPRASNPRVSLAGMEAYNDIELEEIRSRLEPASFV
ncbi:hypothetical protein F5Y15DRAFT_243280 [Xylariaceae sp. FL0016]|nr:hypothetical protein F5Y15DRAFT_243280 [Xylariaceae sp. FL0016]